jgi:hypothetical protein
MDRGKEIFVARRAAKVAQRELEILLELPSGTIGGIERNRPTVSESEYNRIRAGIVEIVQGRKEAAECEGNAALAST